jgi:aldose 1-epimerase
MPARPLIIIIILAAACPNGGAVSPSLPVPASPPAPAFYTIKNPAGSEIKLTDYGARLVSWLAPDRRGRRTDILLGCDQIPDYEHPLKNSFGASIGRYANRIANGSFTLAGVDYKLPINNPPNTLHGGPDGFSRRLWRARQISPRTVEFTLHSPDGDQGFPGNLNIKVIYDLSDGHALKITCEAVTDKTTVINFTNHAYFNLAGADVIDNHILSIAADHYLPVNETKIPTGELAPVAGTPFDFRAPRPVGAFAYDHCYAPAGAGLRPVAKISDPASGRALEVLTDQPGLQLYTADALDATVTGKQNKPYPARSALCLEPQHYPDSPNRPVFPSTTLRPTETFRTTIIYKLTAE